MTEAVQAEILKELSSSPDASIEDTFPWAESANLDHMAVVGAVKSLMSEGYVTANDLSTSFYTLTTEGETILTNGSHEVLVFKAVVETGRLSEAELEVKVGKDVAKIGKGKCMKEKWIKKDGDGFVALKAAEEVEDVVQTALKALQDAKYQPDAISPGVSLFATFSTSAENSPWLSSNTTT
jgi:phenylalanyl-tRNA synthetase alpha chain